MANWFTRAVDRITPWDRGGEVQRRQERKKKEEEEQNYNQPAPSRAPQQSGGLQVTQSNNNQRISVDGFEPKPQKPVNVFEDLNKNLSFNRPSNAVDIINREANKPVEKPKPGAVVTPTRTQSRVSVDSLGENRRITLPDGRAINTKPAAETPEQIINRGLDVGKSFEQIASENRYDINGIREYAKITRPNYGIKVERPQQANVSKFRDFFDANTEADRFRRQEGNRIMGEEKPINLVNPGNIISRTPIVGHVAKTLNTLGAQIASMPATAEGMFLTQKQKQLTAQLQEAQARGDTATYNRLLNDIDLLTEAVQKTFAMQDASHSMFEDNSGGLFNAGTLYNEEQSQEGSAETALKEIALPTAVTALDLYTLGKGTAVSQGVKTQGLKQTVTQPGRQIFKAGVGQVPIAGRGDVAKLVAGNYLSGDLDARAQGADNAGAVKSGLLTSILGTGPDVLLPTLAKILRAKLPGFGGNAIGSIDNAAIDSSVEDLIRETPRNIPVKQNIPIGQGISIDGPESLPQPINVRKVTNQTPQELIQDVSGGERFSTPDRLVQNNIDSAKAQKAFDANKVDQPSQAAINKFEGVTPQKSETFKLDEDVVIKSQGDAVEQYAKWLKEMGAGNGVNLIDDGAGGKKRVTNNVRFGDTKGKRMTKQMWLDEAERQLKAGEADPSIQKMFDDVADPELQSLLAKGEQPTPPAGTPIKVKKVDGINVIEDTNVPQNLPEKPGTVRATTATAPANAKAEAVASQPTVKTPASLPAETQAVLDNPKQFTKRQVAAARNQRKLARQMAKTQEDTAEAMSRIETASPAKQSNESFVETGKFGKSKNGGAYEKASRAAEMSQALQETSQMSPDDVLQTARKNQGDTGGFNRRDIRNISALFESKRIARGTPEWKEARQILKEDGTVWGQTGALRNYTMRRNATTNELISRYESKLYKLAEDPTKIESKWFDEVEAAQDTYVVARDNATKAYNDFTRDPTSANAKKYHNAMDAAEKADRAAKQTEYTVADKALKGNKDVKQVRELQKMAQEADLYQMDAVDASMLSGTGTFIRNFVNASVGGIEETIFGKPAAWISRKLTGESVGGGVGRGSIKGFGKGVDNVVSASSARAKNAGKNPLEHIKNWATTGNQLGDTVMDAQAFKNTSDHYRNILKEQGYKGTELADRAGVMSRADPDGILRAYQGAARTAAGLGQGITRNNKIETIVKNIVSDGISAGKPGAWSENVGKLAARMTVGFPTAIARSTVEGVKRFTLGAPTFVKAIREADPLKRSILLKEGIKQAGTGSAVIPPMFYALGANGMITGSYPDDEEERARWEREGITENSIKIGGAYYQLPAYLGAWAVPGLFYASLGRNGGDIPAATAEAVKTIPDLLPLDMPINKLNDVLIGRSDAGDFAAQMGASVVRASTPAGALLNQLSKSFDPTKNETNEGPVLENFVNKVVSGIPGVNGGLVDVPDKLDDEGNAIKNPNALQVLAGAASAVQGKGEERTSEVQGQIAEALKDIEEMGAFSDENLKGILSKEDAKLYEKAASGGELKEKELESLKDALVKGVSSEGTDTAYLEKEQYDTNITALKMKRELMNSDPTTKPSSLKDIDTAIKRGEIYKENKTPYQDITDYKSVGVEDWRKMGIPPGDDDYDEDYYDPDMYEKLWQLDQKMTKAGVSYNSKDKEKNKYYLKDKKSGSGSGGKGGSGSNKISGDFGKLRGGEFVPKVKQYDTIETQSGSIPRIRVQRPNIVHKITSSR